MRQLRQLSQVLDTLPPWAVVCIGLFLVLFSIASIYGRINVRFGNKLFSKVPPEEIRSNIGHIIGYTVIPVLVTIGFFALLLVR